MKREGKEGIVDEPKGILFTSVSPSPAPISSRPQALPSFPYHFPSLYPPRNPPEIGGSNGD
jgi:hypothetical protein